MLRFSLLVTCACPGLSLASVVEYRSDATGWLAAVPQPQAFAFDSFFPGVSGLGALSGNVAQLNMGTQTLTVSMLFSAQAGAVSDESSFGQVSDAYLPGNQFVSRWSFSQPVFGFYTYYGSFAPGGTMTMTLYRNGEAISNISRESGGNEITAYGHGFTSNVPIDLIDFSLNGPSDEVMIGAFVGLDANESSLGTVTIPGYIGPSGAAIPLDFAFTTVPEPVGLLLFTAGLGFYTATRRTRAFAETQLGSLWARWESNPHGLSARRF